MTSVHDVVKKGECVAADRVPCPKAVEYLKKKGLICSVKPKNQKNQKPAKKKKGLLETWFG
jgi:hypothetical protein